MCTNGTCHSCIVFLLLLFCLRVNACLKPFCSLDRPGTLHDFRSHEIADQLTLLDAELFYKIEVHALKQPVCVRACVLLERTGKTASWELVALLYIFAVVSFLCLTSSFPPFL